MSTFDAIRQLHDLYAVVEQYTGKPITRRGLVCPMPHHTHFNNTPSFFVYTRLDGTQYFKCLGNCGAMGDVIDFVGYMHMGAGYIPTDHQCVDEAITWLSQQSVVAPRPQGKREKRSLNPIRARLEVETWAQALENSVPAQEYLEMRGVLSAAKHFNLGYARLEHAKFQAGGRSSLSAHYISIPMIENGSVIGVKFRRVDTHPDYHDISEKLLPIRYDSMTGGRTGIFNQDSVAFRQGKVFLPEGEFDVMLLHALGYQACTTTTGANSWDDKLILLLANAEVLILEDPDPTGKNAAQSRHSKLSNSRIVSTAPYKDVGDFYMLAGESALRAWSEQA